MQRRIRSIEKCLWFHFFHRWDHRSVVASVLMSINRVTTKVSSVKWKKNTMHGWVKSIQHINVDDLFYFTLLSSIKTLWKVERSSKNCKWFAAIRRKSASWSTWAGHRRWRYGPKVAETWIITQSKLYYPTANNDDSEDSESHDEEEEDDLEAMETNQTGNANIAITTDTTTYSAPEFWILTWETIVAPVTFVELVFHDYFH